MMDLANPTLQAAAVQTVNPCSAGIYWTPTNLTRHRCRHAPAIRQGHVRSLTVLTPAVSTAVCANRDRASYSKCSLTYVESSRKVTHMIKTQVYLRKEELDALRVAAARSGRSIAELIRDAIRKIVLRPEAAGPVGIWDGEPKRTSVEHDSVHDEP
jgi:hypothetical protein